MCIGCIKYRDGDYMNSNQALYWLGNSINNLPNENQTVIQKHFNIIELYKDISIISASSINILAFNASTNDVDLLNICLKICENLNKTLLIFHHGRLDINQNIDERNYININTKSLDFELELKEIKKIIFKSNLHNKKIVNRIEKPNNYSNSNRSLINVIKYIDDNLSEQLSEGDVAESCHYSITYFSKLFHKEIGISFRDYLCSKRINKAKKLLIENRDIKIAIIAYQCGYHDVSYFTRVFKKKTGSSPGGYRKETLNKLIT
uniref:Bifunctional transcriptional activator/DNA repair enzyme AdaA n=1 Tax=Aliivibrio wodanis TaxID=80852 RepID=A0A5Q4ZWA5_9GAMM|nr:Bifunctional transcriptional activator/DNA repair enzyme AdaA [Aliivibrio wodanis]